MKSYFALGVFIFFLLQQQEILPKSKRSILISSLILTLGLSFVSFQISGEFFYLSEGERFIFLLGPLLGLISITLNENWTTSFFLKNLALYIFCLVPIFFTQTPVGIYFLLIGFLFLVDAILGGNGPSVTLRKVIQFLILGSLALAYVHQYKEASMFFIFLISLFINFTDENSSPLFQNLFTLPLLLFSTHSLGIIPANFPQLLTPLVLVALFVFLLLFGFYFRKRQVVVSYLLLCSLLSSGQLVQIGWYSLIPLFCLIQSFDQQQGNPLRMNFQPILIRGLATFFFILSLCCLRYFDFINPETSSLQLLFFSLLDLMALEIIFYGQPEIGRGSPGVLTSGVSPSDEIIDFNLLNKKISAEKLGMIFLLFGFSSVLLLSFTSFSLLMSQDSIRGMKGFLIYCIALIPWVVFRVSYWRKTFFDLTAPAFYQAHACLWGHDGESVGGLAKQDSSTTSHVIKWFYVPGRLVESIFSYTGLFPWVLLLFFVVTRGVS